MMAENQNRRQLALLAAVLAGVWVGGFVVAEQLPKEPATPKIEAREKSSPLPPIREATAPTDHRRVEHRTSNQGGLVAKAADCPDCERQVVAPISNPKPALRPAPVAPTPRGVTLTLVADGEANFEDLPKPLPKNSHEATLIPVVAESPIDDQCSGAVGASATSAEASLESTEVASDWTKVPQKSSVDQAEIKERRKRAEEQPLTPVSYVQKQETPAYRLHRVGDWVAVVKSRVLVWQDGRPIATVKQGQRFKVVGHEGPFVVIQVSGLTHDRVLMHASCCRAAPGPRPRPKPNDPIGEPVRKHILGRLWD